MNITTKYALKTALTAAALTFATASSAAGWEGVWVNKDNILEPGTTIQSIAANANKNAYTSNPALNNNAWGMQGTWLSFQIPQSATTIRISLTSATTNAPGFTIYRTDGAFTGNGTGAASSTTDKTNGAIHSFSQVAQAGTAGIIWATDDSVSPSLPGNTTTSGIVETLGYVNASGVDYTNYYGGNIKAGAGDLSFDDRFESGVYGNVATSGDMVYANLTLNNLAPGYYTIFLGGTMTSGTNTPIDVKVTAISSASSATCTIPATPSDCVFDWAEKNYTTLFSPAGASSKTQDNYYYRYYKDTKYYVGVSSTDNHVYYMGSDGKMQDAGLLSDLLKTASCK